MRVPVVTCALMVVLNGVPSLARPLIGFDDLQNGELVTDQYRDMGVVITGYLQVNGPGAFTNAVSPENSVVFYDPANLSNPASITIDFVVPGTNISGVTDFVCFTPTDASQFNTQFAMRAYDSLNNQIGFASSLVSSSGVYNPSEDPPVFISAPGIARVVLTGSVGAGNMVIEGDDLVFNPVVPSAGSGTVLCVAGLARLRRRRA